MSPGAVVCASSSNSEDYILMDHSSRSRRHSRAEERAPDRSACNSAKSRDTSSDRSTKTISRNVRRVDPLPSHARLETTAHRPLPPIAKSSANPKVHIVSKPPTTKRVGPIAASDTIGYDISNQYYNGSKSPITEMDKQTEILAVNGCSKAGKADKKMPKSISSDAVRCNGSTQSKAVSNNNRQSGAVAHIRPRSSSVSSSSRSTLSGATSSSPDSTLTLSPVSHSFYKKDSNKDRNKVAVTGHPHVQHTVLDRRKSVCIGETDSQHASRSSSPLTVGSTSSKSGRTSGTVQSTRVKEPRTSPTDIRTSEVPCEANNGKIVVDVSILDSPSATKSNRKSVKTPRDVHSTETLPSVHQSAKVPVKKSNDVDISKKETKSSSAHNVIQSKRSVGKAQNENSDLDSKDAKADSLTVADDDHTIRPKGPKHLQMLGGSAAGDGVQDEGGGSMCQRETACSVTAISGSLKALQVSDARLHNSGITGLRNLGNTCFMNSILQCLSNTKPLLEYCLSDMYLADINKTTSRMRGAVIKEFVHVIQSLWAPDSSSVAISPSHFKDQISLFAKRFTGYSEHDAHEFLIYLLEGLHEEVNRVQEKKKRFIDTSNEVELIGASEKAKLSWRKCIECDDSRIIDIFVGQLKSALKCSECGYVSNTFESFHDLSLPIKRNRSVFGDSTSLVDCFDLFSQEEILTGDDRPFCARCKCRRTCTKRFLIQRFPQILIIHLKRFNPGSSYYKLKTSVECPLTGLELSKYSAEQTECPVVYNLYAVSNHSGTMMSGHYTAFAKHPVTNQWHCFNDSRVSEHKMSKFVSSDAYLLFYELDNSSQLP